VAASLWLSWQNQVSLSASDDEAVVAAPGTRIVLRPLRPEISAAMKRLAPPGEDEERLAESILSAGTVDSLARWYYHIDHLRRRGLIRRSLHGEGRPLATLCPFECPPSPSSTVARNGVSRRQLCATNGKAGHGRPETGASRYVLSRFAYMRREADELIVESPLAHARVILHDSRLMSLLGELASPKTTDELVQRQDGSLHGLAAGDVAALLSLLHEANMIELLTAGENCLDENCLGGEADSQAAGTLEAWEFHDLLFHSRSRKGRSKGRFGATYRFGHASPPPALKTPVERPGYELYRPDMKRLEKSDPSLAAVQERRCSLREYAAQPITARQLGEFLYRVARVKKQWQSQASSVEGGPPLEFASRPFPAGGALYELDFYIAVRACQDIACGLYHYDPLRHRLGRLAEMTPEVGSLLSDAAMSAGIDCESLQVLVILASRFGRIAWKYESMAYALTLKNVGVVYQTMYLAATAMNLAPCALGCGDSDLFARATGTDYHVETSVGEFLLGSKLSHVFT